MYQLLIALFHQLLLPSFDPLLIALFHELLRYQSCRSSFLISYLQYHLYASHSDDVFEYYPGWSVVEI